MRRLWIAGGAGLTGAALFAACKLDLDESLIDRGDAAASGGSAGTGGAGTGGAGTGGTGGVVQGDGGPCDADTQCTTDAACLEGLCAGGQCLFAVCPTSEACKGRACEPTSGKCGEPQVYAFKAASLELDGDLACSGNASRCVAALADLVFVATADGKLHAWRTRNAAGPEPLTVDSPTFTVARMVASENRLLVMSAVTSDKVQLAWVDLPSDPKATSLTLSSVGVTLAGATTLGAVYPAGPGGFLAVEANAASFYPAAQITPPVPNASTLSAYPSTGLAAGATIVAAAGDRLVSFRVDASGKPVVPTFGLVDKAGTSSAQSGSEKSFAFETPTALSAHHFASGFDGTVLWSTNRVFRDSADLPMTKAVVLRWLLAPGSSAFDASAEVDLASYADADWGTVRRGPVALVDASTAVTTVAYPVDPQQTLVRAVQKSGTTLTLGSATAVLPFPVGQIGVAANRKLGFVLTPASTTLSLKTTLHVYAPGCG
ncbi:MAG: hypothetical protein IT377_08095 [Polyangiaceae bacterium]|nr:hypothetical protein [Polyangiaceae bacterium]